MQAANGPSSAVAVRLQPGEEIHAALLSVCVQHGVHAGFVVSGIGMLEDPEIGFLTGPGEYARHRFEGKFELLNLSGNVAMLDGSPFTHLHVTLSGPDHQAIGGHLFAAKTAITVEVLLVKLEGVQMLRRLEADSGLPGLCVSSEL